MITEKNSERENSRHASATQFKTRPSFQPTVYESMNEIPDYFFLEKTYSDDSLLDKRVQEHHKKSNSSKSLEKIKINCVKRKSLNVRKISIENDKASKDLIKDEISIYENTIDEFQAQLRVNSRDNANYLAGKLVLTEFRIKFNIENKQIELDYSKEYYNVPIYLIKKIEKSFDKRYSDRYNIDLVSKDGRILHFTVFDLEGRMVEMIKNKIYPLSSSSYYSFANLFCFRGNGDFPIDGWKKFDFEMELFRQGVDLKKRYRISKVNENFKLIPSYPKKIVVPYCIKDEEIKEITSYRFKGRIPVLTYQYNFNKCCIWRSSQPKSGITGQRSKADEKFLKSLVDYSEKLIIFDARPYLAALGGGFESVDNYQNCELKFCEIDNLHAVKQSYEKYMLLFTDDKIKENKKFLSELEKTGWFDFLSLLIKSSLQIVESIKNNNTVLVHCSDGWDRTTQLSSLAQLLIDPFYRTIEGFIKLIEKDWLSFGHPIANRNGYHTEELKEEEVAPIFLQWLDCVHQLLYQFPNAFEFNLDFLVYLASHHNTCLYGTFLFNSEREREHYNAKTDTLSIWSYLLKPDVVKRFLNPYYNNSQTDLENVSSAIISMRIWDEYFLKYNKENSLCEFDIPLCKYKNCWKYFEYVKREDEEKIRKQKQVIDNYKNAIKDISYLLSECDTIPESLRRYIDNLNKNQSCEEPLKIKSITIKEDYI